jgi:hypothetical protein
MAELFEKNLKIGGEGAPPYDFGTRPVKKSRKHTRRLVDTVLNRHNVIVCKVSK